MQDAKPVAGPEDLSRWQPPRGAPAPLPEGRYCLAEPLRSDQHGAELYAAFKGHDGLWEFMGYGPFASEEAFSHWLREQEGKSDPLFYAIRDKSSGKTGGFASFMRITPEAGTIEIGHIFLAPQLQRSRVFTEMIWLMADLAFRQGYRRCEWKCDARNLASRRAAQRYGFSFEGIFRQAAVVKGRNRDTAWFSVIDSEWPELSACFRLWLDPQNFDAAGEQRQQLSALTRPLLARFDPAFP